MDVYILDELLRRTAVIDRYESLIWTERFRDVGDFELVVPAERGFRNLLGVGTNLVIPASKRVMTVETVESGVTAEGSAMLTVSGRSFEKVLEDRVNRNGFALGDSPSEDWILTGTPGNIARKIFDDLCRYNTIIPGDNIPFLTPGSLYPAGTIPEPTETYEVRLEPDTVLGSIKKLCELYNLGFRLVRNQDRSELYFDIYSGNDRTTLQTTLPTVVFSTSLDNLSDTKELTSIANDKNVAYVFAKNGAVEVYADNVSPSISGFQRRVLVVTATDIDLPAGAELTAALMQRGREALAEHRPVIAFDGEISQYSAFKYERDYFLGDLVEMRSPDGLATNMRVTEQIIISDKEGVRSYPTLTTELLITPGSWYAWDASEYWDAATETWDTA